MKEDTCLETKTTQCLPVRSPPLATGVIAVATLAGLVIAALGLRTWRVQLAASADFDLARRLLLEVYRLRDALEYVRDPMMLVQEAAGADPNVPWEVSAYERRWQGVMDNPGPASSLRLRMPDPVGRRDQGAEERANETRGSALSRRERLRSIQAGSGRRRSQPGTPRRAVWGYVRRRLCVALEKVVARFEAYVRPHLPRK